MNTLEERMQQDLKLLQTQFPGIGNSFPSYRKEWIAKRTSCDEAAPILVPSISASAFMMSEQPPGGETTKFLFRF